MILYTALPQELIWEGYSDFSPKYQEITKGGRILLIEPLSFNQGKVVRLISSNPQDYMNPSFQPGEIINIMDSSQKD
ncbi:YlzJ-like family protein [Candidatus Contubernalis alkaliaceticus]|uniref:YlzJ-like family protein n=1 Tax=Candidatus Contubernalis alkaliaceticus TaxID=338645 RepID=UPI001F4C25C6|nr:YlzJ-like family protein [Candidatus Contubernalis alkalaceticus]UNC91858.1 YlzJ-like family protein [Candidatus Contubernalis alkalaceticus]